MTMVKIMKKEALWCETKRKKTFPSLKTGIKTDILIIGGGMVGISLALELEKEKKNYILIEADQIGHGVTGHSTGKLTFLQEANLVDIEKAFGQEKTDLYLKSQQNAIDIVTKNIIDYHIDCNFESTTSITFTNDYQEIPKLRKLETILERNNIPYHMINQEKDPEILYGVSVKNTAVFHPVKYLEGILPFLKGKIFEHTKAIQYQKREFDYLVNTEEGYIIAKTIVFACHYPFFTIPGLIPFKTHIERSYLCSFTVDKAKSISVINTKIPTISYRYHRDRKDYMIYLRNSHRLGQDLDYGHNYQELIKKVPTKNIDYIWQNQDVMTEDHLPLIGPIEKGNHHLLFATGFNTWGMTNGPLAAQILKDMILEKENPYQTLFLPNRGISLEKIKNFMIDTFYSGKNYIISKRKNYYSFYLDKVKIEHLEGKKVGIYLDENEKMHIVCTTCPHLGCGLTFNTFMKTWDCPCHGSRFTMEGKWIEGPSTKNINID